MNVYDLICVFYYLLSCQWCLGLLAFLLKIVCIEQINIKIN